MAETCKPNEVVVVKASCDKFSGVTSLDKWIIAVLIGLLFLALANPFTFRLTNMIFGRLGFPTITNKGTYTLFGVILHTIIFIIIVRLIMH